MDLGAQSGNLGSEVTLLKIALSDGRIHSSHGAQSFAIVNSLQNGVFAPNLGTAKEV